MNTLVTTPSQFISSNGLALQRLYLTHVRSPVPKAFSGGKAEAGVVALLAPRHPLQRAPVPLSIAGSKSNPRKPHSP
jgi:hypothetical protein